MRQLQATSQLYGKTVTLKRVSKAAAKKAFCNGVEIYLQSSNMYPFGVWQNVCPIKLDGEQLEADKNHYAWCINGGYELPVTTPTEENQFEYTVCDFKSYNCDGERGKYVSFFIAI